MHSQKNIKLWYLLLQCVVHDSLFLTELVAFTLITGFASILVSNFCYDVLYLVYSAEIVY